MIQIKDLQKSYGEKPVLSHFSHDLPDNGIVCLTGASGRGKTTLLRILAGWKPRTAAALPDCPAAKLRLFFKRTVCCPGYSPAELSPGSSQPGQNDQWESC